jgi:hypothetical protein
MFSRRSLTFLYVILKIVAIELFMVGNVILWTKLDLLTVWVRLGLFNLIKALSMDAAQRGTSSVQRWRMLHPTWALVGIMAGVLLVVVVGQGFAQERPQPPLQPQELQELRDLMRMLRNVDLAALGSTQPGKGRPAYIQGRFFSGPRVRSDSILSTPLELADAISVPGLKVTLRERSGTLIGPFSTDHSGRFRTSFVEPGSYQVCVEGAGFVPFCADRLVNVVDQDVYLLPMGIAAKEERDKATLFGRVKLADDTFPRAFKTNAGVNAFVKIVGLDRNANKVTPEVAANDLGDYVLPLVPVRSLVRLVAVIENGFAEEVIRPGVVPPVGFSRLDMTVRNSRPIMVPPVARLGVST